MRALLLIGVAALAFGAVAGETRAETGPGTPAGVARINPSVPSAVPAVSVRGGTRPAYVLLSPPEELPRVTGAILEPPIAAAASPGPDAAPRAAEVAPWCRSGRIVGTGAGFCLVN